VSISQEIFGTTDDGRPVERYTMRGRGGVEVDVIGYGGLISALRAPDREGVLGDIVLGFDTLDGYLAGHPYFGSLIGRYGNRIARGAFALNGVRYQLARNNGENHLHGGVKGFDKQFWRIRPLESDDPAVELRRHSHDGEEGYPGNLDVSVVYTLGADNALRIDYTATTDADTILNLTNHSYFNLAGAGDVLGHELMIAAEHFLPTDAGSIPIGERRPVEGTPMDFRRPTSIGAHIRADDEQLRFASGGFDHTWVLDEPAGELRLAARLYEPGSGRVLETYTTQPGIQFYSGNFLDGSLRGKGGRSYERHGALCLETQHFPDSPNQPGFPSTVLRPGETYRHTTIYKFGAE